MTKVPHLHDLVLSWMMTGPCQLSTFQTSLEAR